MNCPNTRMLFKDVPVGSTIEVSTPGNPGEFSTVIDLIGPTDENGEIGPGQTWTSQPLQHPRTAYLIRVLVQHNLHTVRSVSPVISTT